MLQFFQSRLGLHVMASGILLGTLGSLVGCKELTGSTPLPSGTQNPTVFNTPAGAVGMWASAIQAFQQAVPGYLVHTGLLTDELQPELQSGKYFGFTTATSNISTAGSLDARILPEESFTGASGSGTFADQDYDNLQLVRSLANQALGALATYDTGAHKQGDPVAMRSQLYAVQGYVEILLADFFCSGVPLSTLDYQKDFTYHPSSTTQQVYQDALVKLDSAAALAGAHDSVALQQLAQVLQGRALLALGEYPQAAAAVASVPTSFQYQVQMQVCLGCSIIVSDWFQQQTQGLYHPTVSNRKGGTGLPYLSTYLSGGDPRLEVDTITDCVLGSSTCADNLQALPTKYAQQVLPNFVLFTVADGIEARLIEAEAQLQTALGNPADTTWLHTLNLLRQDAAVPGTTEPDPAALPPLADPGASLTGTAADTARINLLFRERAYWLFLTGHRQGDLRRLIREYDPHYPPVYTQAMVYPTGAYPVPSLTPSYGTDVTAPIPGSEYINPQFYGCLSRSA